MQRSKILVWCTSLIAIYHFVVVAQLPTWFRLFIPHNVHLAISILSAMVLIFLLLPAGGRKHGEDTEADSKFRHVPWYDFMLMGSALIGAGYVIIDHEAVLDYGEFGFLDAKGIVLAVLLVVPVMEAVRRTTGWALPIIILFFVSLTLFQQHLPGLLYGRGYPPERMLYSAYVGDAGVFGLPLGIAANIVIVFLTFGALMEGAGASRWFMDMALALTGLVARRAGQGGGGRVGHVRIDFGLAVGQLGHHRRFHHSDDEEDRLHPGLRRRGRGGGVDRRHHPAAGDGCACLHHGRVDRGNLYGDRHRRGGRRQRSIS